MKILFLVKFYQPFDRGGSEWSTHDLAKLLANMGHKVTILTPNYGAKAQESIEGIEILRFPFLKLKNPKGPIAPYWTNNIVWFIYSSLCCIYWSIKRDVDVIHAHSNEFIPAAAISSLLLKIPSVVTFRDYQVLCNLGFCLWKKDKVCSLSDFITNDFQFFWRNYVLVKSPIKYTILLLAAVRARLMQKIIYFFAKRIKYKVAVSEKVRRVFTANGIKGLTKIHNPVIVKSTVATNVTKDIIYLGKFSKGKGIDILLEQIPEILKKVPEAKFKLIGSGYLERELKKRALQFRFGNKVLFTGHVDHSEALKEIKKASLVIVPSIWPEPLPRSAIETLLSGTPVVATKVGGLPEIVKDRQYGVLCDPEANSLKNAIILGFERRFFFRKNIARNLSTLKKHFTDDVIAEYQKMYQAAKNT